MSQNALPDTVREAASAPIRNSEHPFVSIPFGLVIDGRSLNGVAASLVGAEALGLVPRALEGETRLVTMQFAFTGFFVSLQVEARLETIDTESGTVSLRFLDPAGPHLPQLRYILNSFIAGDLVGVDRVIAVANAPRDAVRRPLKDVRRGRFGRLAGRLFRTGLILLLAAALVAVAGFKLYERLFVLPTNGLSVISQGGMTLGATSSGQVDYVDLAAVKGTPVFAVRSVSGDLLVVQMPCDCVVTKVQAPEGQTVLAGDPVLQVAPANAPLVVETRLSPDAVTAMSQGASALVRLADGSTVTARLDPSRLGVVQGVGETKATLIPDRAIPPTMAGLPATVSVAADPFAGLRSFFGMTGQSTTTPEGI